MIDLMTPTSESSGQTGQEQGKTNGIMIVGKFVKIKTDSTEPVSWLIVNDSDIVE